MTGMLRYLVLWVCISSMWAVPFAHAASACGTFLDEWGGTGAGVGQFTAPDDVAVDGAGNVYVADSANDRIQVFDGDGNFIRQWGSLGAGNGQFDNPVAVTVDGAGNVYVADQNNDRVQKFDSTGSYLTQWGTPCILATSIGCVDPDGGGPLELGDGQFHDPAGLAVSPGGEIYVTDSSNHRIQRFSSSGVFLGKFGTFCTMFDLVGCVDPDGLGPLDVGDGGLAFPRGIAIDSAGDVYVADSSNHRVQKFTSTGAFVFLLGTMDIGFDIFGSGDGEFFGPNDVDVDGGDNLFVIEAGNQRVQKFSTTGLFLDKWGTQGGAAGQFVTPNGIAVDTDTNVFAADTGNDRIQKFACPDCGDGRLETGEQCDDGGTVGGDCCDPACDFESGGSGCDDGDPMTVVDVCDGSGVCVPTLGQWGIAAMAAAMFVAVLGLRRRRARA